MKGLPGMESTIPGRTAWETSEHRKDQGQTASLIQQLRAVIRLLETHPGLPLHEFAATDIQYSADTPEEVDRIAGMLGVTAAWNADRSHYTAVYKIGREVSYRAVHITREHMAAWLAHTEEFHRAQQEVAA